jgi:BRCT domain type II-containing protein
MIFVGGWRVPAAPVAVSRNTSYLVAGENTGARKTKKAKELGIKVINETEFLALLM